jgi:GT2 family glycosyltransferase
MSTSIRSELSIIIVNWNSAEYVRECLASIISETPGLQYEVIVVDNASSRDDLGPAVSAFPFVTVIRNPDNVGFARANNIGFRNAKAPHILFLNPDTRIVGPALVAMVSALKEQADAGIVGCKLLNSDLSLQTSCVQRYPRVLSQVFGTDTLYDRFPRLPLWGLRPLFRADRRPIPVEAISGACLMVRRETFEQAGLFSEEYFMYAEDVDLCYKAAQAGWRCYHLTEATVVHHGGGCSRLRTVSSWAAVVQCGAKLQFMRKTRGVSYGNLYRLAMAMSAAVRLVLLAGMAVAKARPECRRRLRMKRAKWAAILAWSLRPDRTVERLTFAKPGY